MAVYKMPPASAHIYQGTCKIRPDPKARVEQPCGEEIRDHHAELSAVAPEPIPAADIFPGDEIHHAQSHKNGGNANHGVSKDKSDERM